MNSPLELQDIQGFLVKGYGYMPAACYKMLQIHDAGKAKQWLASVCPQITTAERQTNNAKIVHNACVNVGISYYGLQKLGLNEETRKSFAVEFVEYPLDSPMKQHELRIFGDVGKNAPENWHWGANDQEREAIHILLMLFAPDEATLNKLAQTFELGFTANGLIQQYEHRTTKLPNDKEHFGFRDGIAQPEIEGYSQNAPSENLVKAGEFILGYMNEYNILPESPYIEQAKDAQNILPACPDRAGYKDIGKNGSYLVFRQLEQDVKGFWSFVKDATQEVDGYSVERLGAKIVGRWRSGAPVTKCPAHDNPALAKDNDFVYANEDKDGMGCPIGAHIRRSNPRDTFMEAPKKSLGFTKKHRLMRRGRSYGVPFVENFDLEEMLRKPDDGITRGLYFLAINANFGRQFNFIQQTWVNDGGFQGLEHEPDALLGSETEHVIYKQATYLSMPQVPVRQRIRTPHSYIRVRGSMNFFMPSLRALQWLSNI